MFINPMDQQIKRSAMIKAEAVRLGFDGCGIARAGYLQEDAVRLKGWLDKGYHGDMAYMENHFNKRVDPRMLVEGTKSVITVIMNYYPAQGQHDPDAPVLSKYAYGEDYHPVIKKKLRHLLAYINKAIAPAGGRAFVDSAPVLDRAWAARAGLGWIGKHTNLISPRSGSFIFIGSLFTDLELAYDEPMKDLCGDCVRCIRACPTNAIIKPRVLDARKCISYLTIENKGEIDPVFRDKFHNRVFGCDICQDVCPWNRRVSAGREDAFKPLEWLLDMKGEDWHNLNEDQYDRLFARSAVKRTKYGGLRRNLDFIV
jgi:epoxyqueuosine reductase